MNRQKARITVKFQRPIGQKFPTLGHCTVELISGNQSEFIGNFSTADQAINEIAKRGFDGNATLVL